MSHPQQESKDKELIQRLVDGELDHRSRSKWLSGIEDDSSVWREVALAFVERQLFDESLGAMAADDQPPSRIEVSDERQVTRTANDSRRRRSVAPWVAGLVACWLVGVFLGFILNKRNVSTVAQIDEPVSVLVEESATDSDRSRSIELADALSRSVAPVPNEFRRALRKAGYSLRDRQTITNVSLPSGGEIEMPVRHVDVEFIGISTFQ